MFLTVDENCRKQDVLRRVPNTGRPVAQLNEQRHGAINVFFETASLKQKLKQQRKQN